MDATRPVLPVAAGKPAAGTRSARAAAGTVVAIMRSALRAPFTHRSRTELLYCLISGPVGVAIPVVAVGFVISIGLLAPGPGKPDNASIGGLVAGLLLVLILATGVARRLGAAYRRLAAVLLDQQVTAPSPFRSGRGIVGRLAARFRDRSGWRAVAYLLLKLPVAMFELYAVAFWVTGFVNLSYPLWWGLFRNHPQGVHLRPLPVITPFSGHTSEIATYPGTLLAFAVGAVTVLAAPWVTRAAVSADRRLMNALLGPGGLAQRVRQLEQTRAMVVDDSAALLRRLERDLHDGAQIRLATLAMKLGMAKEKLSDDGEPDLAQIRELVDAAHKGAKDALTELRDLARGIHPPALDVGLADALTTLAASSSIPTELTTDIPIRPTPAIETIAYFCAAELLANAAKHSSANTIQIHASELDGMLRIDFTDDGIGGADPARGSGLSGLAQRASTVDGRLDITSPPGGPTRIVVQLPLRA